MQHQPPCRSPSVSEKLGELHQDFLGPTPWRAQAHPFPKPVARAPGFSVAYLTADATTTCILQVVACRGCNSHLQNAGGCRQDHHSPSSSRRLIANART